VIARLDAAQVRDALSPAPVVLDRFGAEYRDRPQIRLQTCPACNQHHERPAVVIDRETVEWCHHGHACRGDALSLVAAFAGLDIRRDFERVLELAADIAGLRATSDTAELLARATERRAAREAYEREHAAKRAVAQARAAERWQSLERRNIAGERYLDGRGLAPAELRRSGDVVRFWPDGSPVVKLHHLETGDVINVVRRQLRGEPKVLTLPDCGTDGALVGRVGDLDTTGQGVDVAVLVEGVADTLAAVLAFPGCVVLGANGAGRMVDVARAIAPCLVGARGWLLIGVHSDESGIAAAAEAIRAATAAGLALERSVDTIEIGAHKDLADAWRAGWRWRWPERLGPGGAA
jgi:hypothetical protein